VPYLATWLPCRYIAKVPRTIPPFTPLRRLRVRAGLTQLALAIRAGCSANSISLIERGAPLSAEMAERLARALHCNPSDLTDVRAGNAEDGR